MYLNVTADLGINLTSANLPALLLLNISGTRLFSLKELVTVCNEPNKISDDTVWILTSTFTIFTMQSGFGLLESGTVQSKNEVNIMVKNAVDVVCGALTYWMFGFGLSYGEQEPYTNFFCGWGYFFVSEQADNVMNFGKVYAKFFFQTSFATTSTTIVSGAMAERTKLSSYILFSLLNIFVICIPSHWTWGHNGWLKKFGVIDIAGAGPVHLVGGVTGLIATIILKPRYGRFCKKSAPDMCSPTNAILGTFMLWWGWLGFNCGSTFGISGRKWVLAARSAIVTLNASIGGGIMGLLLSYLLRKKTFDVGYLINSILGALVASTAICINAYPWEAFIIGAVGAILTLACIELLNMLKIDDPCGVVGVHAIGGIWGLLAVGLFGHKDPLYKEVDHSGQLEGVFRGGGFYLLGIQSLMVAAIIAWTAVTSFILLKTIDVTCGLRMSLHEEQLGADIVEHNFTKPASNANHETEKTFGCFNPNFCLSEKDFDKSSDCDDLGNATGEQRETHPNMSEHQCVMNSEACQFGFYASNNIQISSVSERCQEIHSPYVWP